MKKVMLVVALAVFLSWGVTIFLAEFSGEENKDTAAVLAQLTNQSLGEAECSFQRKIASWYNLNLTSVHKDAGFSDAYWDILDFGGNAMGYISVPSKGICAPIYHGADAAGQGAGHLQQTAFPLGAENTHSAMQVPFSLEEGDFFYLHLLEQSWAYQVGEREYLSRQEMAFEPRERETLCTLVMPLGAQVMLMQGELTPSAPAEEEIVVRAEESSDGFLVAVCLVLALGILLVPFIVRWWK